MIRLQAWGNESGEGLSCSLFAYLLQGSFFDPIASFEGRIWCGVVFDSLCILEGASRVILLGSSNLVEWYTPRCVRGSFSESCVLKGSKLVEDYEIVSLLTRSGFRDHFLILVSVKDQIWRWIPSRSLSTYSERRRGSFFDSIVESGGALYLRVGLGLVSFSHCKQVKRSRVDFRSGCMFGGLELEEGCILVLYRLGEQDSHRRGSHFDPCKLGGSQGQIGVSLQAWWM